MRVPISDRPIVGDVLLVQCHYDQALPLCCQHAPQLFDGEIERARRPTHTDRR
jgi:hypothetical protein